MNRNTTAKNMEDPKVEFSVLFQELKDVIQKVTSKLSEPIGYVDLFKACVAEEKKFHQVLNYVFTEAIVELEKQHKLEFNPGFMIKAVVQKEGTTTEEEHGCFVLGVGV